MRPTETQICKKEWWSKTTYHQIVEMHCLSIILLHRNLQQLTTENTLNFHNFAFHSPSQSHATLTLLSIMVKTVTQPVQTGSPIHFPLSDSYLTVIFLQDNKPCVPLSVYLSFFQGLPTLFINKAFSDRLRQKRFIRFYGILNVPLLPRLLKGLDGDAMTATHQLNAKLWRVESCYLDKLWPLDCSFCWLCCRCSPCWIKLHMQM